MIDYLFCASWLVLSVLVACAYARFVTREQTYNSTHPENPRADEFP